MLLNADDKATDSGALPYYLTPGAILRRQVIEECRSVFCTVLAVGTAPNTAASCQKENSFPRVL